MRRALIAGLLLLTVHSASAEPLRIAGSLRSRVENWSFFETPGYDDKYSFAGILARVSAAQKLDRGFDWQLELAAPLLVALPDHASAPAPFGQLGIGGSYFTGSGGDENAFAFFPKQAFVRYRRGSDSIRAGRFEMTDGSEGTSKNAMLGAVRSSRVAQRLIGAQGFSHVGRSLDGFQYSHDVPGLNITAAAFQPAVGSYDVDGSGHISGVRVLYGSVSFFRPAFDVRFFVLGFRDSRTGVTKSDNRPSAARAADRDAVQIVTAGGNALFAFGEVDVLLWGAVQSGDWGALDHKAGAFDIEAGRHWGGPRKPALRAGFFRSSGDGNPSDGTHETFFQVLPTNRTYARFPLYNAMNNTDAFATFSFKPSARVTLSSEAHALWLTEASDLWYSGGGAFEADSFGFSGRPSNGHRGLVRVADLGVDLAVNPKTSVTLYTGVAHGGDVVKAIFAGGRARYVYLEVLRRF